MYCPNSSGFSLSSFILFSTSARSSGNLCQLLSGPKCIRQVKSLTIKTFTANIFFFWPRHAACGILVPRPGMEPVPPAVEARSLNRWTTREVPANTVWLCMPCNLCASIMSVSCFPKLIFVLFNFLILKVSTLYYFS